MNTSPSATDAVAANISSAVVTKKIALCMIVKNEEKIIERCLSSVLPLIDSWVIVDTGSTDGTLDKIK